MNEKSFVRAVAEFADCDEGRAEIVIFACSKRSKSTFRRLGWNPAASRSHRQRWDVAVFPVAAVLLVRVTPICAASSTLQTRSATSTLTTPWASKTTRRQSACTKEFCGRIRMNALAHYHLGYAYGMNHEAPAESREYVRATELGLHEWDLFLNLGLLYMERNELPAAINALEI